MKFCLRFLGVCSLLASGGQPSPCLGAEKAAPVVRSIRFALEDDPYLTELTYDDQPVTDLRYAAIVRGFAPLLLSEGDVMRMAMDPNALLTIASSDSSAAGARLRKMQKNDSLARRFRYSLVNDFDPRLAPASGPHVVANGTNGLANTLNIMLGQGNWFSGMGPGPFWNNFTPAREIEHQPLQEYALLAPSVEEAKQFAEDFLYVYDEGFIPLLRTFVKKQKAALQKMRADNQPKLAELDKKIAAASREVEGVESLSDQAVSDLKVKRTLLKVELAGVEARINAIEDKIKTNRAAEKLQAKLADLKVSADIDLASLAAQQKVLDELIAGQQRLTEIGQLRTGRILFATPVETAAEGLPRCDEILADLQAFQLADDTVIIRPVRFQAK